MTTGPAPRITWTPLTLAPDVTAIGPVSYGTTPDHPDLILLRGDLKPADADEFPVDQPIDLARFPDDVWSDHISRTVRVGAMVRSNEPYLGTMEISPDGRLRAYSAKPAYQLYLNGVVLDVPALRGDPCASC